MTPPETRAERYADHGEVETTYAAVAPDGYVTTTHKASVAASLSRSGWYVTAETRSKA